MAERDGKALIAVVLCVSVSPQCFCGGTRAQTFTAETLEFGEALRNPSGSETMERLREMSR